MSIESELWANIYSELGKKVSAPAMTSWFDECTVYAVKDSEIVFYTPSKFKADILELRWRAGLLGIVQELLPGIESVKVICDETRPGFDKTAAQPETAETLTFDNFVVGNQNKFAHGAARAVASGATAYNPLFIYGNSGLGKTHLLRAVRHAVRQTRPDSKIIFITSEVFTNDLITSLNNGSRMEVFREKYRTADLFLVDDVQFIANKPATEEEFFHTFNELYENGKQIILTSDRPPQEIRKLEERLRTRFESGLIADIQPPDYETRVAIVLNKAKQLGFLIDNDIAVMLAETLTSNIRQLEGAVKTVHALIGISGNDSLSFAEITRRIKDTIRESETAITAELIIEETASYFDAQVEEIKGKSRVREIAKIRQIAMYLIREMTNLPYESIGDILGGRDHTTIMSGIRNVASEISENPDFQDEIHDLSRTISSRASERA